jgi:hypothetical protein
VTRLYGLHNTRGPYFTPESPYALGDVAPMSSMQPIDDDTLFTALPQPGVDATSAAPLGSAGFPTFQATAPGTGGTILGPSGATVPELSTPVAQGLAPINAIVGSISAQTPSQSNTTVASAMAAGGAPISGAPVSYTSPYGSPVATLAQAQANQGTAGPITFIHPWPSIVQPPSAQTVEEQSPSMLCELGNWVSANPLLALLGTVGVYCLLQGRKKR